MKRFIFSFFLGLTLVGCANTSVQVKDGKEYVAGAPVVAKGTMVDIRVTEKDGTVTSLARAAGDVVGDAGIGAAATAYAGMSVGQGSLALGAVGIIADLITATTRGAPPVIVVADAGKTVAEVPVPGEYLEMMLRINCIDVGDQVVVAKMPAGVFGQAPYQVYNADPDLHRGSDLRPSCSTLTERKRSAAANGAG